VGFAPFHLKKAYNSQNISDFASSSLFKLLLAIRIDPLTKQEKNSVILHFHSFLFIRNNHIDHFVTDSLKLSAYALTHNYSKPRADSFSGSNGSDTCFSNEVYVNRKIRIRTKMFWQRALEYPELVYSISSNFAWLNTRNFRDLQHQTTILP